jgi:hypothetical protein
MRIIAAVVISMFALGSVLAQSQPLPKDKKVSELVTLAKESFEAHGGEKLKALKSLSMFGSVDITSSAVNQAIPAKFSQIFSGDKYRLEVDARPMIQFVQVFDGRNTETSPSRGFELPPINKIGLMLLQRFGQTGYAVSESLGSAKSGFRMTSPDGYFTDFEINKKTKRVKGYSASYFVGGREVTTLVEIDKFVDKEGIIIPTSFAQRFEVGGMIIYADFKTKTIEINGEIEESVFSIGSK